MGCEMCGADDAPLRARVEGVEMQVCRTCSAYGKVLDRRPEQVRVPVRPRREDPVERVDPKFPTMLRQQRERRKLTHDEFARLLRIRASTYHHYESGDVTPSVDDARMMGRILGIRLVMKEREEDSGDRRAGGQGRGVTIGDLIR